MSKSSNNLVNPNAREAMNRFKMEAASEVDVPDTTIFTHITIYSRVRLVSAANLILHTNRSAGGTSLPDQLFSGGNVMTAEYRINSAVYRVERTFIGTRNASDLIRKRVMKDANVRTAGKPYKPFVYQTEKAEKIS